MLTRPALERPANHEARLSGNISACATADRPAQHQRRPRNRLPPFVLIVGALLLFISAIQTAWTVAMIAQPGELLNIEAIVYDKAARIFRGEPLYQPLDRAPYTVAAYTPIYYWLGAAAMAVLGPGFGPGRLLSFLAGLAAAGAVAAIAAQRARDRRAGLFAALLFLALGVPAVPSWLGLYREQVLAVALSLGAVAALTRGTSRHRVLLAAVLTALAFLTKQIVIAGGAAIVVWLWRRDRTRAAQFAGLSLTFVLVISTASELATGAFLINVVAANVNPFSLDALATNLLILALFQAGPLALAATYVLARRRSWMPEDELLILFWIASCLPILGLRESGRGAELLDRNCRGERRAGYSQRLAESSRARRGLGPPVDDHPDAAAYRQRGRIRTAGRPGVG